MKYSFFQYLTFGGLLASAVNSAIAASDPIRITPTYLDGLVTEAVGRNPMLAASRARADAANSSVGAVRVWEDPTATLGVSVPTSRGFKASEEGNLIYGIDQKLPLFDRPKLARDVALAEANRQRLSLSFDTAKLRRDISTKLIALALADATVDLAEQDLGWLETTLTAVDNRYRVGKASQIEWLKVQTERAKAIDHIKTLRLEREHRQVELNRMLNRDLHAAWQSVALPDPTRTIVTEENLVSAALRMEPGLKVDQQEIVQGEAASRLTKQRRRPEVGVGVQGRSYTGDAGFREGMVTVNFTLPWLNAQRYDSDYARDRALTRASEYELADRLLSLREEIHHLFIDWDAARRQTALYRDELIPLTEQTLSSTSSAWANNLGALQDLLDARRMMVDNRLMLAQASAEQARVRAELGFLTGSNDLAQLPQTPVPAETPMNMPEISK